MEDTIKGVASLLEKRAIENNCSYWIAWDKWLTNEEKKGLLFSSVRDYVGMFNGN